MILLGYNLFDLYIKWHCYELINMKLLFYIYGQGSRGKTTFVRFLTSVLNNTTIVLSLGTWKTPFGRLESCGADLLIFDDIDTKGLNSDLVSQLKAYIGRGYVNVAIKHGATFSMPGKGCMFFLANSKWSYKGLGLETDSGWQRRFIYIPLLPGNVPTKNVYLSEIITKDAKSLINWAMAAPDDLLESVSKNAEKLSQYFESTEEPVACGTTFYFTEWFFSKVRVKAKGFSDNNNWEIPAGFREISKTSYKDTLYYSYHLFTEERSEERLSPTAFKVLLCNLVDSLNLENVCWSLARKSRGRTLTGVTLNPQQGVLLSRVEPLIITDLRNAPVCTFCLEKNSQNSLGSFDWKPTV